MQTRVLVSTIQGHHWSGGGGGVKQVPLLEVTDSRQFYDPLRRECAPALWLQNFIWFNMESVVKFAYIPRPTLTILKFMIFLFFSRMILRAKTNNFIKFLTNLKDVLEIKKMFFGRYFLFSNKIHAGTTVFTAHAYVVLMHQSSMYMAFPRIVLT